jgi:hypothetical protein
MEGQLSIKRVGVSASAVLAVPYLAVTLASLFLAGVRTTGSWPATFLGMGWNTLIGFELGFVVIVIASFGLAAAFVPIFGAIRRRVVGRPQAAARRPSGRRLAQSWAFRVLMACLVLPALALLALRAVAQVGAVGAAPVTGAAADSADGRSQAVSLGPAINTAMREAEPSFTADGRTMVFNCYNGDLCLSHLIGTWEAGSWTPPERLGAPINTEYEEVEPIISRAGDKLYFMSRRPTGRLSGIPFLSPFLNVVRVADALATPRLGYSLSGGLGLSDVYISYKVDGAWSEPLNLNDAAGEPPINTAFDDHCLSFSADGDEAFWTSTQPGGLGDNDLWTSRRVDGKWTEPENLGPSVNGPESEHHSIPTPDGQSLYVTATRPIGFGEEDIYITTRGAEGEWRPLVNLGPLINGPGDDRCPAWTPDHRIFLFDTVGADGSGARDIAWVYFAEVVGYPHGAVGAAAAP